MVPSTAAVLWELIVCRTLCFLLGLQGRWKTAFALRTYSVGRNTGSAKWDLCEMQGLWSTEDKESETQRPRGKQERIYGGARMGSLGLKREKRVVEHFVLKAKESHWRYSPQTKHTILCYRICHPQTLKPLGPQPLLRDVKMATRSWVI